MREICTAFLWVVLVASTAIPASAIFPDETSMGAHILATGGKAKYAIYLRKQATPVEERAARELADYLHRISGATFVRAPADVDPCATPLLIVGRSGPLVSALNPQVDWERLGAEGFVLRTQGPHLIIAGAHPVGTLWAVYWLLDRQLGVRWFAADCTVIPQRSHLVLPSLDITQMPRFAYREIFALDGDDEAYRAHNLLNGKSHHRLAQRSPADLTCWSREWADDGHNFHRLVPLSECGSAGPDCHFGGQLAMMSECVRTVAAAQLMQHWGQQRSATDGMAYMGFSQEDRGWSADAASVAFAARHGGTLSAPLMDMVIDVATRVRRRYPRARLSTLAYQWSFSPPMAMEIPDWVQVTLAPIHADFGQPLDGPRNSDIARDIQDWARISTNLMVWDYLTNFGSYIQPHPNIDSMCHTIQWLSGISSIRGYFGQGAYGTRGGEFSQLRTWVAARLLWDPSLDAVSLVDEFLDGYYGKAAPPLRTYLRLLHASLREAGTALTLRTQVTAPYLSFQLMHRADLLFSQAEAAVATDPPRLSRVRTARLGVDYVILLRRADYAATAAEQGCDWAVEFPGRLQRFRTYAQAAAVDAYGEGVGGLAELCQAMEIPRRRPAVSPLCAALTAADWMEFQDLSLRRYDQTRVVFDPLASDTGAIRMPGNTDIWGVQLTLDNLPPHGSWDLYADVRVDPGSSQGAEPALRLGVHPPLDNQHTVSVAELADGAYHSVRLPGGPYHADAGHSLWIAPPGSDAVKSMYVDRVIAVRHGHGPGPAGKESATP